MKSQIQIGKYSYVVSLAPMVYRLGHWVEAPQKFDDRGFPIMTLKRCIKEGEVKFYFRGYLFYMNNATIHNGVQKVFVTCPITGYAILITEELDIYKIYDLAVDRLRENWERYIEIISNIGVNVQLDHLISII